MLWSMVNRISVSVLKVENSTVLTHVRFLLKAIALLSINLQLFHTWQSVSWSSHATARTSKCYAIATQLLTVTGSFGHPRGIFSVIYPVFRLDFYLGLALPLLCTWTRFSVCLFLHGTVWTEINIVIVSLSVLYLLAQVLNLLNHSLPII